MKNTIIYPGYGEPSKFGSAIPDTPESRQKALANGATAFTTTSFEFEPMKGKPEPKRYGSWFLDFDSKHAPEKATAEARYFVDKLENYYGVPKGMLRYWLSGGKGCHIEIPAKIFGGEGGHSHLPKIFYLMTLSIKTQTANGILTYIDMSLYCMGKGRLLRQENIQRQNGRYKVPVSCEEFFNLPFASLWELTKAPRQLAEAQFPTQPQETPLVALYRDSLSIHLNNQSTGKAVRGFEMFENCKFLQHCKNNAATLSEPGWHAMVTNMVVANVPAHIIHEYSQGHPGYTRAETDQKIQYARQKGIAHTCATIRQAFDCPERCDVNAPWQLADKGRRNNPPHKVLGSFHLYPDGLYTITGVLSGEPDAKEKVCSPVEVIAKSRNEDSTGWSRRIKVTAPDGVDKQINVAMSDLVQNPDSVVGALVDNGLELEAQPDSKKKLIEYIKIAQPVLMQTATSKIGWHGDSTYVLPDRAYGVTQGHEFIFSVDINHFAVRGSLEDWQREIGRYLQGNKLLVLAVSYAFCGILLTPCEMEGMGLHIYGPSSCGKTTTMRIAASICGGGGQGYIRAWRTTDNALESIAVQHNDNLLCLDEIGQADERVVSEVAYMLPNGQGKGRAKRSGNAKAIARWTVAFMSTGEVKLDDKITAGRQTVMAGQLVRVLDIPADAGDGMGIFSELHGFSSPQALSIHLGNAAMQTYGSPMRAFLEQLTHDCSSHVQQAKKYMRQFVQGTECEGMSAQITRVRERFALIAAAGELAIQFGVLPLTHGEALDAALHFFNQWVELRGGTGDSEIESAIRRVQDFLDSYSESRFMDLSSDALYQRQPYELAGYKWKVDGELCLMFFPAVFQKICQHTPAARVKEELASRGWLALNTKGEILGTKHIPGKGKNMRGVFVIPERWNEVPEALPSHVRTHAQAENTGGGTDADINAKAEAALKNQDFDDSVFD